MDWGIGKRQQHISGHGPRKIARLTIMRFTLASGLMERSLIMYGRTARRKDRLIRRDHLERGVDVISCPYVFPDLMDCPRADN